MRFVLTFVTFFFCAVTLAGDGALTPWKSNRSYWSYRNEPVLLLGGSDDDNLFQWPEEKLVAQLDRLAAAGGNVVRNTMSDRDDGHGHEIYPFEQLEDGRYDLDQWNDEYWARFDRFLRETAKRRVFVQLEVWDRFDFTDLRQPLWQRHPYNPKNNVNYSYQESGFAAAYPDHPGKNRQPFFYTIPTLENNQVVLKRQQQFVDRLLEMSLQYDHVLYCMDNETNGDPRWGAYWAKYIQAKAAQQGMTVNCTEMWDEHDLRSDQHRNTFDYPELYSFVDVSQNNHKSGQQHWDNFLFVKRLVADAPRPLNTTKTYGADGNKFGHNDRDAVERFWRHLLAGVASARFHRPPAGLGLNDKAVASLRAARLVESMIPLWEVEPNDAALSQRDPNEAYLAARPGHAYLLFFPAGGEVSLDLSDAAGQLSIDWVNIGRGEPGPRDLLMGGRATVVAAPDSGTWAAAIRGQDHEE